MLHGNPAELRKWPVSQERLADKIFFGDRAEFARIGTMGPVVSGDEVATLRDDLLGALPQIRPSENIDSRREVGLINRVTVDVELVVFEEYRIAGKADDALDVIDILVSGRFKNDDFTALGFVEFIFDFVGQNEFAVMEIGFHRRAVYLLRGHDEEIDHDHDRHDDDDPLEKIKKSSDDAL